MLTRDQILQAQDLTSEAVEVPEWQGLVYVRVMTGAERERFLDGVLNGAIINQRVALLVLTLCDAEGGRLFGADDLEALAGKSSRVIERLFFVARRLNGLEPDANETALKNSEATLPDASGSGLPLP